MAGGPSGGNKVGLVAAVSSVVASMIGAGIFALPTGVAKAGLVSGLGISLTLGWFLFTIPALMLSKCCELCEEIDEEEQAQKALTCEGGDNRRRSVREVALDDMDPKTRKSLQLRGAPDDVARVSVDGHRASRTVAGAQPAMDSIMNEEIIERRSEVINTQTDKFGRVSVTIVEEDKKVYLIGDVAEKAFGARWARMAISGLGNCYLLFACAIFLLLMGEAVQLFTRGLRLLRNDATVYTEEVPPSCWFESLVFTGIMMLLVQVPDVSIIARVSLIGTAAAMAICIIFIVAPSVLHTTTPFGVSRPVLANLGPTRLVTRFGETEKETIQSHIQENTGTNKAWTQASFAEMDDIITRSSNAQEWWNSNDFFLWEKDDVTLLQVDSFPTVFGSFKRMLESLSSCAFGFAFALLVPYVRADLEKPSQMGKVIWIATILTAVVYAIVVFTGLLAGGQKFLLRMSSIQAMPTYETRVAVEQLTATNIPPRTIEFDKIAKTLVEPANVGEALPDAQKQAADAMLKTICEHKTQQAAKIGEELLQCRYHTLKDAVSGDSRTYIFYLYKNLDFFFGRNAQNKGKASIMVFVMVIFLALKLLISYPLTVWPSIQDFEGCIVNMNCARRCRKRVDGGNSAEAGNLEDRKAEEKEPLLVEGRPLDNDDEEEQFPEMKDDQDENQISKTASSDSSNNKSGATYKLTFWASAVARIFVVAFTFGLAAIFKCSPKRLDAFLGLAASVPGMLSMVIFPLIAVQLLQGQLRKLRGIRSRTCGESLEFVFHIFLMIMGSAVMIYTIIKLPADLKEAFA
ncbi:unnamed protein product [Amoebophrya sp. A25]|nr:unnamed protein product [Amoebophrya sp. A25]|eukprot:GSA25T00008053001.1